MAHVVIMPRQGNTVESCVIVRWKAAAGDRVKADSPLCEVETDKASFEVPAGAAGTLLAILRADGDDVPVLMPIAVIGEPGEDWKAALPAAAARDAPGPDRDEAPLTAPGAAPSAAPRPGSAAPDDGARPGVSPRARRLAAPEGLDASSLPGSGPGGRVIERDVKAALEVRPALTAAARAAAAAGAALPEFGTALGGRAGLADLAGAVSAAGAGPKSPAPSSAFPGPFLDTPVKGVRRLIADRLRGSLSATAQVSFHGSAPAERIREYRARFKASDPALGLSGITIGDLVLFAVSRVLPRFPQANAHLLDGTLRTFDRVHLGLAVDTPRGLLVPVIRNADLLSLERISAESKRLSSACLSGTISPDELSGSTFTVSNLGSLGIEGFTPILNAPETAILGVCSITQRAVAGSGGALVLEPRLGLSLTVDHQVLDGAPAARILKAIADGIADIDILIAK